MLPTIVRAILVFIAMCLVSAARPAPAHLLTRDQGAHLDLAKARLELATRRAAEPTETRTLGPATIVEAPSLSPRNPAWVGVVTLAPRSGLVAVVSSRSARGPPA